MTIMIPAWVDGTLQPLEKLEVHRRGLRHVAISVFLTDGARILLQRRALGKYHTPGLWANTCCTHPHWGEPTRTCAARRLREELGLTPPPLTFSRRVEYRADVGGGLTEHELVDIFTGRISSDIAMDPNPDEVMDTRWITPADLAREIVDAPARYTPWLRIYMAEHGGGILDDLASA